MISTILVLTILPLLLILSAVWDLTSYTIPNALPAAIALLFLLFAALAPLGWGVTGGHLLTGAGALVLGIILFSFGWIGGGDAKLYAACALWLGWQELLPYTLISALIGGGLSLLLIGMRKAPLPAFAAKIKWINTLHDKKSGIPYGIALAGGFLLWLPDSGLLNR